MSVETTDVKSSESAAGYARLKLGGFYLAVLATLGLGLLFLGELFPLLVGGWFGGVVIA